MIIDPTSVGPKLSLAACALEEVPQTHQGEIARSIGFASLFEPLQVRCDMVRANLIEMELATAIGPPVQMPPLSDQRIRLLAGRCKAGKIGLLKVS